MIFYHLKYVLSKYLLLICHHYYRHLEMPELEWKKWCFLCLMFSFHSHSKVNCGKKQIIILVSTNSTPKYPFLTPYLPICTQLKIENIVSFLYMYYLFEYNILQDIPGCSLAALDGQVPR